MKLTRYCLLPDAPKNLTVRSIAVAADLHDNPHTEVLHALRREKPDIILIPGDLMDDQSIRNKASIGYDFLRECAKIAPTFYSVGNHEIGCYHKGNPWRKPVPVPLPSKAKEEIGNTGAILLDNEWVRFGNVILCGLTSGIDREKNEPNAETLRAFASLPGSRILLCHHPEYFVPYVQNTTIALTVCGPAHGGHWRFFGHGVYAPGQGLFPKYTAGVIDGRCVISRGLGNHTKIPRLFNKPELLLLTIGMSQIKE